MLILPQDDSFDAVEILEKHRKWFQQKLEFTEKIKKKYKNQKIYERNESDLIKLITNLLVNIRMFWKKNQIKLVSGI